MNHVSSALPSLKPELFPVVSRSLSKLKNLAIVPDPEAEDVFEVVFDVAGTKVKCLVDLTDFNTRLDTM